MSLLQRLVNYLTNIYNYFSEINFIMSYLTLFLVVHADDLWYILFRLVLTSIHDNRWSYLIVEE